MTSLPREIGHAGPVAANAARHYDESEQTPGLVVGTRLCHGFAIAASSAIGISTMLRISHVQMRQFGAVSRDRFVRRMATHLRTKFADRAAGVPDEQLTGQIELGMSEAERHGVVYEDDIRRYLEWLVIFGAPLDQQPGAPWLADILHGDTSTGRAKLDLIDDAVLQLVRQQKWHASANR